MTVVVLGLDLSLTSTGVANYSSELADLAAIVSADTDRPDAICCTNWILVAEWSTTDGEAWCSRWTDDDRPMWQHQGLLHHALHGNWGRE